LAPAPATTKAPTPSQILVLDFMMVLETAAPALRASRSTLRRARAETTVSIDAPSSKLAGISNYSNKLGAMQIVIGNVLSADDLAIVTAALARAHFVDGRATAGFAARTVKNNRQADDRKLETVRKLVTERIMGNEVFRLAVRPKALTPLLFSRYQDGMNYGSHVDDALMDGLRTDVSFTLFLSDPESYDGGELVIESASGDDAVKLAAGSLV